MTLTLTTVTLKARCTASWTWSLLASGCTWKMYLCWPASRAPFSVIRARWMTCIGWRSLLIGFGLRLYGGTSAAGARRRGRCLGLSRGSLPASRGGSFFGWSRRSGATRRARRGYFRRWSRLAGDAPEGLGAAHGFLCHHQVTVDHHVDDVQVVGGDDLAPGQVARGQEDLAVRLARDDKRRALRTQVHQDALHLLGLRLVERQPLDNADLAVRCLAREGGADGEAAHLLGQALAVVARFGTEGDAATAMVRRADGTLAGPAGVLLHADLAGAALDLAAGQRAGAAAALGVAPGDERLVQDRDVRLNAEDVVIHLNGPQLLTFQVFHRQLHFTPVPFHILTMRQSREPPATHSCCRVPGPPGP